MKRISKKSRMIFNVFIGVVFLVIIITFYSTFSLEDDYKIDSLVYDIGDGYIDGVSPYTDVSLYLKYFDLENCSVEVVDDDDNKIVNGYVSNGSKTVLYDRNEKILASYINIIKGDYTKDGVVDSKDFREIGSCLVKGCSLEEYQLKSLDIDLDGEFHQNDLLLLDQAISLGYTGISLDKESMILQTNEQGRLVAKVSPSYGINQNVKWTSLDENIVTVDEAGRVTGKNEGETKIRATTLDGKFMTEATIKVDNTIQLLSYEGVGYVGGNNIEVGIKSIDYEGITCSVSDANKASCEIIDDVLNIKPLRSGDVTIVVRSPKYGEATYKLAIYWVDFSILDRYACVTPNVTLRGRVRGFSVGELSYVSSVEGMIKDVYMKVDEADGINKVWIEIGDKTGRVTVDVKESNGNNVNVLTFDVYKRISVVASNGQVGSVAKMGEDVYATIKGEHFGVLSCESLNPDRASCRIEGNQLIVMPLALGSATINVYNQFSYNDTLYDCGNSQFMIVTRE